MEEQRPVVPAVVTVLASLSLLAILTFNVLIFVGDVEVRIGTTVFTDLTQDDRPAVWAAQLPLSIVLVLALLRLITVAGAVRAGNSFSPVTLRALRQMSWLVGLGGFVCSTLADLLIDAVVHGGGAFSFTFQFGWLIAGVLIALVTAIVREGVRRSQPSYAGPAGPPAG